MVGLLFKVYCRLNFNALKELDAVPGAAKTQLPLTLYRAELADLCAYTAAYALGVVDNSLSVSYGNRGAAELQAHFASSALVVYDL